MFLRLALAAVVLFGGALAQPVLTPAHGPAAIAANAARAFLNGVGRAGTLSKGHRRFG